MTEETKKTYSLKDKGVYFLNGDIRKESTGAVINWILESNLNQKDLKNLILMINSYGGSVSDGFAIIDVMKGSKIPVHTVGIGVLASMGLMVFLAGSRGHRILTPNTEIMSHQFWSISLGKEHELFAAQKGFELTKNKIYEHYRRSTGLSDEEIKTKLLPAHDVYLSAHEALDLNLCDEIKIMGSS